MRVLFVLFLIFNIHCNADKLLSPRFGFLYNGEFLVHFQNAKINIKSWLKNVASSNNVKLDVKFYDDINKMYTALKNDEVDMIVVPSVFFFQNREDIEKNAEHFWSLSLHWERKMQYYLISKNTNRTNGIKGIRNKIISIKRTDKNAMIWLDKNSLLENKKGFQEIIKTIKYKNKNSEVLFDVFFGKSDYGVITSKDWDILLKSNPNIKDKLKIIKKSKKVFIPFLGIFNKQNNEKAMALFFRLGVNLKKLANSDKVVKNLNFNYVYEIDKNTLDDLGTYYLDYFELQKKNR